MDILTTRRFTHQGLVFAEVTMLQVGVNGWYIRTAHIGETDVTVPQWTRTIKDLTEAETFFEAAQEAAQQYVDKLGAVCKTSVF